MGQVCVGRDHEENRVLRGWAETLGIGSLSQDPREHKAETSGII